MRKLSCRFNLAALWTGLQAVALALTKASVTTSLERQGLPIALKTPAEMSAMLPAEVAKWAAVIKLANVTVD